MYKKTMCILIVALMLGCLAMCFQSNEIERLKAEAAVIPQVEQMPGPEVKEGHYTIFQYCQNGWTNHLYTTAYYINDHQIFAELREYPGEFIPIDGQVLPIPKWIEDPNELMEYGFWEPGGYE